MKSAYVNGNDRRQRECARTENISHLEEDVHIHVFNVGESPPQGPR